MGPRFLGQAAQTVRCRVSDTQVEPSPAARAELTDRVPAGTEKVRQAQECGQLHVVNPDWLWSCLERWDRVEEQLFPLRADCSRAQR